MPLKAILQNAELEEAAKLERAPQLLRPQLKSNDAGSSDWIRTVARELARRTTESLALYEPLEHIQKFHSSRAPDRILRGSNRGGKTLGAAVEISRAVTSQDPYKKYPTEDGRCFIVGKDGKHNSEVLYRKLFRPGAYRLIQDLGTNLWRPHRPWEEGDKARMKESKPAPPLIPPRMIKDMSWENKKEQVPNVIRLNNGWEIRFFSSLGAPPQGSDVDLCLAGWSMVYDPVMGCHRRIDTIRDEWHVLTEKDGEIVSRRASRPFVKGVGEIVRVSLSNGRQMFTTRRHRVKSTAGVWVSIQQAYDEQVSLGSWEVPSVSGSCTEQLEGSEASLPLEVAQLLQSSASSQRQADTCILDGELQSWGFHASGEIFARSLERFRTSLPVSQSCIDRTVLSVALQSEHEVSWLLTASGCAAGYDYFWNALPGWRGHYSPCCHRYGEQPRQGQEVGRERLRQRAGESGRSLESSHGGALESTSVGIRSRQSRPFVAYPPVDDEAPQASESWHRAQPAIAGLSSCRSDGVGKAGGCSSSCSFPAGQEVFVEQVESCGEHPIWDMSVEDTHTYIYDSIMSHNCWFDEEIVNPEWYPEISARLIDRRGKFVWSATAQLGGAQLYDLSMEAADQRDLENPRIVEFFAHIDSNPHFDDEQRTLFFSKLSEEQRRIRIEGEFAFTSFKVYPEYSASTHNIEWFDIPKDWTRYMVLDPGRQVCAVLFAAVPPPTHKMAGHVLLYDELYIRNANAARVAEEVRQKIQGHNFYAFIIDHRGGRVRNMESGNSVEDSYSTAFKAAGVKSQITGHGFLWGSDDVEGGIEAARGWLVVRKDGTPRLKCFHDKMMNFHWECERYHYKRDRKMLTDKPEQKHNHLMDCFRYLALYDPQWHEPPKKGLVSDGVAAYVKRKQQRAKKKRGGSYIALGPQGGNQWQ